MKTKIKKSIALLLSFIMLMSLFGCGKENIGTLPTEITGAEDTNISDSELHKKEVPEGYVGIYSVDDLKYIISNPQYNYILMNDIDFSLYDVKWKSCEIDGIFDGNNYKILNYNNDCAFLSKCSSIFDLTFENANISSNLSKSSLVSVVCERIYNDEQDEYGDIYNVHVYGNIDIEINNEEYLKGASSNYIFIGGVCSTLNNSSMLNCSFSGNISVDFNIYATDTFFIGGCCGRTDSINNSVSKGNIVCNSENPRMFPYSLYVGGIAGDANAYFCTNYMDIISNGDCGSYGGICGLGGYLTKCCNYGNLTQKYDKSHNSMWESINMGGIAGRDDYAITNCYNAGNVIGGEKTGGILGEGRADFTCVYNIGKVETTIYYPNGKCYVGAILGYPDYSNSGEKYGSFDFCYYTNTNIKGVYNDLKFPFMSYLTEEDAKSKESYNGFDFENDWKMGDDSYPYPVLKNVNG